MRHCASRLLVVVLLLGATYPSDAMERPPREDDPPDRRDGIRVPIDFPTIQQAIEAAVDGDTIVVERGNYEESLWIRGKNIELHGYGNPILHGPPPSSVGRAEDAVGLINFVEGGGGTVKGFVLEGGDNGIVAYSQELPAGKIRIEESEIRNANRGVLVGWAESLEIKEVKISNSAHHGLVTNATKFLIVELVVIDSTKVGHIIANTAGECGPGLDGDNQVSNSSFHSNLLGGVVVFNSFACVFDSLFYGNGLAAIRFVQSTAWAWGNTIEYVFPDLFTDLYGDGIVVAPFNAPSDVNIFENFITNVARAGLSNFGSHAKLSDNTIQCAGFGLEGENLDKDEFGPNVPAQNLNFTFTDGGGNICGCPIPGQGYGECVAVSAGLEPPTITDAEL